MILNKTLREEIIQRALDATFIDADAEWENQCRDAAVKLYEHTFDASVVKSAAELPSGWVRWHDGLMFLREGWRRRYASVSGERFPEKPKSELSFGHYGSRPFPLNSSEINIEDSHPLASLFDDLASLYYRNRDRKIALVNGLTEFLNGFRTVEKLREAWPEGVKFLPKPAKPVKTNLPVDVALKGRINALMGIK